MKNSYGTGAALVLASAVMVTGATSADAQEEPYPSESTYNQGTTTYDASEAPTDSADETWVETGIPSPYTTQPSDEPTAIITEENIPDPSPTETGTPSSDPTPAPTSQPAPQPTESPAPQPTENPAPNPEPQPTSNSPVVPGGSSDNNQGGNQGNNAQSQPNNGLPGNSSENQNRFEAPTNDTQQADSRGYSLDYYSSPAQQSSTLGSASPSSTAESTFQRDRWGGTKVEQSGGGWINDFLNQGEKQTTAEGATDSSGVTGITAENSANSSVVSNNLRQLGQSIIAGKLPLLLFSAGGVGLVLYLTRQFARDAKKM